MEELAEAVAGHLKHGDPVALGFECPLFVPLAQSTASLTRARVGEGSRPWSAGAGCSALATGLVQVVWILREIRRIAGDQHQVFLDWDDFDRSRSGILIWEAFVTGTAKRDGHIADAKAAVDAFLGFFPNPQFESAVTCPEETYSLIGAALLRTGWTRDLDVLSRPCIVIRAMESP
jgi:hypothetical protein